MRTKVLLYNLPPAGGDLFPISLGYIAASLFEKGFETAIAEIDALTPRTAQEVANFVIEFSPRVVGFSVCQVNVFLAAQLAKLVKMIDPSIVVVLGGPQATFMPSAAMKDLKYVDVLSRGEGETVLPEIAAAVKKGKSLSGIKGITYREGKKIFDNPSGGSTRDLDRLPSPYRAGAFDLSRHKTAAMITSRGCPFNCAFCYTPKAFPGGYRAHSTGRIMDDIGICYKSGIRKFFFADPSFTCDKKRVREIMKKIISKRLDIEIWCETRTDLVDKETLSLMSVAGVKKIAYGLESADEKVNRILDKKLDLGLFSSVVKMTQKLGMEVEVFSLYGLPGQTVASCKKTLDLLKELGIEVKGNSSGQQLELFFGTEIANDPSKYGIKLTKRKKPLYLSAGRDYVTREMTKGDMKKAASLYKAAGSGKPGKKEEENCVTLL
jgi:radical SAM superfamily enzyme YgiQ (UPF0313 family)